MSHEDAAWWEQRQLRRRKASGEEMKNSISHTQHAGHSFCVTRALAVSYYCCSLSRHTRMWTPRFLILLTQLWETGRRTNSISFSQSVRQAGTTFFLCVCFCLLTQCASAARHLFSLVAAGCDQSAAKQRVSSPAIFCVCAAASYVTHTGAERLATNRLVNGSTPVDTSLFVWRSLKNPVKTQSATVAKEMIWTATNTNISSWEKILCVRPTLCFDVFSFCCWYHLKTRQSS